MERERDESTTGRGEDPPIERRQTPRLRVTLDARLRRLGRSSDDGETTTIDVSQGGARVHAPAQIGVGDVVELTIGTPHGIEVALQGLVVSLSDDAGSHHAHVAFDSLSASAADLLTEMLKEQAEWSAAEAAADPAAGAGVAPPDTATLS